MKKTPWIAFGNDTLEKLPLAHKGQEIDCPQCHGKHELQAGKTKDGEESMLLLFYECGNSLYMGAVAGRLTIGQKADVSGEIKT